VRFCVHARSLGDALIEAREGQKAARLIDFWRKSAIWLQRAPHFSFLMRMCVCVRRPASDIKADRARDAKSDTAIELKKQTDIKRRHRGVFFPAHLCAAPVPKSMHARVFSSPAFDGFGSVLVLSQIASAKS
jgi:hypothetical protein